MATVYLIGAGPGAPDLLTLRAARVLEQADIVFYDALVHPEVIALAKNADKIAVGKRCGKHSTAQKFINKRLIDATQKYERIVRVKGGDPMLFGRAQEELDALQAAGIPVEIVPGVTAALAASAHIGVSLTRRGLSRNVVFVTPRVGETQSASDWVAVTLSADTAAIYMGAGQSQLIADTLIARGRSADTPIALVESASLAQAQVRYGILRELPTLASQMGDGPAVILLGEVLREKLADQMAAVHTLMAAARS
ncbi:MAG TPA: uroporphyrinogen-III C-methyltransferase [Burkholderiales bacterium]|nr:uroporphyrinogen-III C-methyltransferase [Burkholderiales bacterium]